MRPHTHTHPDQVFRSDMFTTDRHWALRVTHLPTGRVAEADCEQFTSQLLARDTLEKQLLNAAALDQWAWCL